MDDQTLKAPGGNALEVLNKFSDPDFTADGSPRAKIQLRNLDILWINTGTLCNLECTNCYIESSPKNDRLVYFTLADANDLFDEIEKHHLGTELIGFTGGEPFLNPDMIAMAKAALVRGLDVLILTNAAQPMQRPKIKKGLLSLKQEFGSKLSLRISLDHFSKPLHDKERGAGSWDHAIVGIDWLAQNGFVFSIAGRTCWGESEETSKQGYAKLFADRSYRLDVEDNNDLLLLPEMDGNMDVAEITTKCWDILNVDPNDIMCATSRMVVKRKGEAKPSIIPCTLLPYELDFHMGTSLAEASTSNGAMFDNGAVKLNHHYCAKFCVLGGGSCAVG